MQCTVPVRSRVPWAKTVENGVIVVLGCKGKKICNTVRVKEKYPVVIYRWQSALIECYDVAVFLVMFYV